MIEFEGLPSGELRKYVLKQNKKLAWACCAIGGIPLLGVLIYLILKLRHPIVLLGFLGIALWILLFSLLPLKKDIPKLFATKLTVLEDGTIITCTYYQILTSATNYVKRVIDVGNGYVFIFKFRHRTPPFFHCQKDQITKGTIEQFEELFKDKIVRLDDNK